MVEGCGERDTAGGGVSGADGVEEVRDGVVHVGDGVTFPVEPEVSDEGAGGRQGQPEPEQPGRAGEIEERPLPPALRQRHPGPDGGGDEELRTGSGGDGSDGADAAGEEPEAGEEKGERHGTEVLPGVRPDEQPGRPCQGGHPDPGDGDTAAAGAVVDAGEHGGDGGHHAEGGAVGEDRGEEEGPGGQGSAEDRAPGDGSALGAQGVGEPGRESEGRECGAGHRAPVGARAGVCLRATVAGRWVCGAHRRSESWRGWDGRISRM